MTLSLRLKDAVEYHCKEFERNSSLFKLGREKRINHYHVTSYVINLEHLFFSNARDILKASEIYKENRIVSQFFQEKWEEERGHDAWAKSDWVKLSKLYEFSIKPPVLKEMIELTDFLSNVMKTSPFRYIAYIFTAEYMTPILGPIWLSILDSNLGIKSQMVTALSKHVELDVGHAFEVGEFLDSLQVGEEPQEEMIRFVDEVFQRYNIFFTALADAGITYGKVLNREVP